MKNPSLVKLFTLAVSFGTVTVVFSKLLGFILKLTVARLGVTNFGEYYLVTATFVSLATLASLGIPMSITRFISYFRGRGKTNDTSSLIASSLTLVSISAIIAGILLYVTAHSLAIFLEAPETALYLQILSVGVVGVALTNIARAVFLGTVHIPLAYGTEAIDLLLRFIGVMLAVVWLRLGVLGAVIGYTIGTLIAAVINLISLIRHTHVTLEKPKFSLQLIRYAWPVGTSEIATTIAATFLLFILRVYGGREALGNYAAAISVASLIHILPQMILSIFLPLVSERYAKHQSIMLIYQTLTRWLLFLVIPITLCIALLSPLLTSLLFGPTYSLAAAVLPTLATAHGIYAIFVWPQRQIIDIAGFTKLNLIATAIRIFAMMSVVALSRDVVNSSTIAYAVLAGWVSEGIACFAIIRYKGILAK